MPESARFLAANGRTEEALAVLRRIAEENGKPMLAGRLIVDDLTCTNGGAAGSAASPSVPGHGDMNSLVSMSSDLRWKSPLQRLLSPELKLTSLLLWFIWLACAFCYYGMVLMSTELLAGAAIAEEEGDCLNRNQGGNVSSREDCSAGCRVLTSADYTDLLWTTLAEFPGIKQFYFSFYEKKAHSDLFFVDYRHRCDTCCDRVSWSKKDHGSRVLYLQFIRLPHYGCVHL